MPRREVADVRPRARAGLFGPRAGEGDCRAGSREKLRISLVDQGSRGQRGICSALARKTQCTSHFTRFIGDIFFAPRGVSVALPFLASLSPPARGAEKQVKRRFVAINL